MPKHITLADWLVQAADAIHDMEPEPMSPYDGSVYEAACEAQRNSQEEAL